MLIPPASPLSCCICVARIFSSASFIAAMSRSCSISTSSASTTSGFTSIDISFGRAFMTTATAPPPAVASTVVSSSFCCASAILACICCSCFIRSGFIPRFATLLSFPDRLRPQLLRRLHQVPARRPRSRRRPGRVHQLDSQRAPPRRREQLGQPLPVLPILDPLQAERVVEAQREHVPLQRLHLTRAVEQRPQLLVSLLLLAGLPHLLDEAPRW